MRVVAVRISDDSRNAIVRSKCYAFAVLLGFEAERTILVVRGMEIPAAQKRTNTKLHCGWRGELLRARSTVSVAGAPPSNNSPAQQNCRFAFRNEQLLLDDCVIVDLVTPTRPRFVFEEFNARGAVGDESRPVHSAAMKSKTCRPVFPPMHRSRSRGPFVLLAVSLQSTAARDNGEYEFPRLFRWRIRQGRPPRSTRHWNQLDSRCEVESMRNSKITSADRIAIVMG